MACSPSVVTSLLSITGHGLSVSAMYLKVLGIKKIFEELIPYVKL